MSEMPVLEFTAYPKTPRLFRDIVVTEKIDGTNAAIGITEEGHVYAQSRKRLITPGDDNFGFARWVSEHTEDLTALLGPGLHFGEWWGQGIQRGYGLTHKAFSLFNVKRWEVEAEALAVVPGLRTVPVLYRGPFCELSIRASIEFLADVGSVAAPGFMRPEGVVVYHSAANQVFKVLVENDELPKGVAS